MPDSLTSGRGFVLGMDSSAGACSAALVRGGELFAREHRMLGRGHAEVLLPMVRTAMSAAGCGFADLAAVAATVGPGSFTGLRVGLAAARGIALAVGVPCIGVTTLEALAFAARAEQQDVGRPLLAVLDTRRGDLYAQIFAVPGTPASDAFVARAEELPARLEAAGLRSSDIRVVGDAADLVRARLGISVPSLERGSVAADAPDAAMVALIAETRLKDAAHHPARPLYLRAAQVTVPADGGSLRP